MPTKLLEIITVDFDVTDPLLIIYSAFISLLLYDSRRVIWPRIRMRGAIYLQFLTRLHDMMLNSPHGQLPQRIEALSTSPLATTLWTKIYE